jgi:hypothetical protein
MIGLGCLHPQLLGAFGLGHGRDAGGIFVKLALHRIGHLHQRRCHRARYHARRLEIPVGAGALAGHIGEVALPFVNVVAVGRALRQPHLSFALRRR